MTQIQGNISEFTESLDASTSAVIIATGQTGTNIYSLVNDTSNPDRVKLISEYQNKMNVEEDIKYIDDTLPSLIPNISSDFDHFKNRYFSSLPDHLKYQELIGFRSTMFLKLIFPIGGYYNAQNRRDQVSKFVYGNNNLSDPYTEQVIDSAKNLYSELSSQSASGQSVKIGNVTPEYVAFIFDEIINTLSSLLKQRSRHFIQ